VVLSELDLRLDPELRLAVGMLDMHVHSSLLAREEVEAVPTDTEDRRAHMNMLASADAAESAPERGSPPLRAWSARGQPTTLRDEGPARSPGRRLPPPARAVLR